MAKRKALFMICLLAVAFGLTALVAVLAEREEKSEGLLCVTSFYPVQLLAESVAEGAEGVTVRNLTENHSGCIHDYTLTTRDMRLLSEAELLLINGGEMELFLEKAAAEYKDLEIVDTSKGYDFLEGVEHSHDHGAEEEDDHEEDAHAGHSNAVNAHIWMDIDGYLLQLSRVEEAFVAADPAQTELYRANAEACRKELTKLKEEYVAAKEALSGKETVVFHEGFVYLLNMLGIESVHCLAMDSDTQIAAGEAAEIMEECKRHNIAVLFAEADYVQAVEDTFAKELSGTVIALDPITGGSGTGVSYYCEIMRHNLDCIKQAYDVR